MPTTHNRGVTIVAVLSESNVLALNGATLALAYVFRRMAKGGACYAGADETATGRVLTHTDREAVYTLRFVKQNTESVLRVLSRLVDLLAMMNEAGMCYTHTEVSDEQKHLTDDERAALCTILDIMGEVR